MTKECEHELWVADCTKENYTIRCVSCGMEFDDQEDT